MEQFRRRNLPHWDVPGGTYFVTACLEGSIPAKGLLRLREYHEELAARPIPEGRTPRQWAADRWKMAFRRAERLLDDDPPVRHLADPRCAEVVVNAFYFFAGNRYDLLSFVVMPSHIHWLFRPRAEWSETLPAKVSPREKITSSVGTFTSNRCNVILGKRGRFWQHEGYDHWVRDADEFDRIVAYIELNPVKAGLVERPGDWPYSSAFDRSKLGLNAGQSLTRRPG